MPASEANETTPEVAGENVDMRTEHAGSTPLPKENTTESGETEEARDEKDLTESAEHAPIDALPSTVEATVQEQQEELGYPPMQPGASQQQQPPSQQLPPSINQLAIVASAQNKLPVNKVKGIVLRLSRHTESSGQKTGKWFKNEKYVDKDSYSWKNLSLFEDHQCHLWTPSGTVRNSYKK